MRKEFTLSRVKLARNRLNAGHHACDRQLILPCFNRKMLNWQPGFLSIRVAVYPVAPLITDLSKPEKRLRVLTRIKGKGVSDYEGNKQEFSGHKNPAQVATYDRKVKVVDSLE